ncbi:DUF4136 domain-containing protein [Parahaliea maris]|uniref:DUF4136 domain-containing protein n=1 Tax=Parahaliea maris TaxID=2716870 RepID=A0A5C8ZNG1_9GAMM|nr:DUF4136 domain-containing protein [Parahaliea maris]TXS89270.1 DUF4136 domain-containing protein [Parahaliea maris]
MTAIGWRAAVTVAVLAVAACATQSFVPRTDFNGDYDFSQLGRLALRAPAEAHAAGLAPERVEAITLALAAAVVEKGITVVEDFDNADAVLSWHLASSDPQANAAYNQVALYSCWRCGPATRSPGMPAWQAGTLVVDVLDRGDGRSLWRAELETRLTLSPGDQLSDEERRDAARSILASFPPGP